MSQIVNRLEPDAKKEPLSIVEIQAIKMGLEDAITKCMRGELRGIVIAALSADSRRLTTWTAGSGLNRIVSACHRAVMGKRSDEPPEAA